MSRFTGVVLASTAAVIATVLLFLGYEYGPQLVFSRLAVRESKPVKESAGSVATTTPLDFSIFDRPRAVPEIRFADDQDHDLTLGDFRRRVVLLNVWATWCVPCREEMPALDRLQAKLGGEEFLVVPLSIDRQGVAAVKRFYRELALEKLGTFVDPSGRASRALDLPGVPTTLLIDREGREVARKMGAAEWDGPEMMALIRRTIDARSGSEGAPDR